MVFMSKNKQNVQGKNTDRKKQKMTLAIIVLAALFIVELYLMMNRPTDYLILGAIALVMLIVVYRIIDLGFKIQDEKATKSEKEYENLFKSNRMSYLYMKENFEDMYVILKEIEENSDIPIEDLIESQKAVAKVTIHRSKENATALMNSNEKLIEKMFDFEAKLKEIEKLVSGGISAVSVETEEIADMAAVEETMEEMTEMAATEESMEEMTEMAATEESIEEMTEMAATEESIEEMSEMAAIEESMEEIADMAVTEETIMENTAEETEISAAMEELIEDTVEIPMEEPQVTVSDDPNHVMTPDEIAKLLGETNAAPAEPPVAEEKPPMPDTSDPNHVMTPDEIAALLANV